MTGEAKFFDVYCFIHFSHMVAHPLMQNCLLTSVEVFADGGAGEMLRLVLESAYYYVGTAETPYAPALTGVAPHAASEAFGPFVVSPE